jgi:hypothetical protein
MNTHSTVLNDASAEPTTPDRILQTALAAWRQGNFVAAANQFNEQFTFTDHALGLEFKDNGRGNKDHCRVLSTSDVLTPSGWTKIKVIWELSVKAIDNQSCELTNHRKIMLGIFFEPKAKP